MSNSRVLRFETNVPVQLALPVMQGLPMFKGQVREEMLVTVDGQRFTLPVEAAERLRKIARADEPFMLCRRHGRFDFWLSNAAEKSRAEEEAPAVARQLRDTISLSGSGQGSVNAPADTAPSPVIPFPAPLTRREELEPLKPTGTDSLPVPALVVQPKPFLAVSRPTPPGMVGYGPALEHICKTVKKVLCETGLPLGDGPMQDLISTVFIAAQKEKAIDFDFGEEA